MHMYITDFDGKDTEWILQTPFSNVVQLLFLDMNVYTFLYEIFWKTLAFLSFYYICQSLLTI